MIYNSTSIGAIRARVVNDFAIEFSDWKDRSIEWIVSGMLRMDIPLAIETVSPSPIIDIDNHVGMLPCDLVLLRGIEYQGVRLPRFDAINAQDDISLSIHSSEYYTLTGTGYIHTSFPNVTGTDTVLCHYKRFSVDEEGYPMIPDNEMLVEALSWYVLLKMLGRGYKHPVFNYNDVENRVIGVNNPMNLFRQAKNSVGRLDEDGRQQISSIMTGILRKPYYWKDRLFIRGKVSN